MQSGTIFDGKAENEHEKSPKLIKKKSAWKNLADEMVVFRFLQIVRASA